MNRRTFLKATVAAASGLILPDWLVRAESYIDAENRPYLERPATAHDTLYAVDWGGNEYQLTLGDPYQGPPTMTWREFFEWEGVSGMEEYIGSDDPDDLPAFSLDNKADEWAILDRWVLDGSPSAEAFKYLDSLNLGPDFGTANSVGEIKFYDGVCPGNDSRLVTVPDDLSISLLQKRLNDLGEGIVITMGS